MFKPKLPAKIIKTNPESPPEIDAVLFKLLDLYKRINISSFVSESLPISDGINTIKSIAGQDYVYVDKKTGEAKPATKLRVYPMYLAYGISEFNSTSLNVLVSTPITSDSKEIVFNPSFKYSLFNTDYRYIDDELINKSLYGRPPNYVYDRADNIIESKEVVEIPIIRQYTLSGDTTTTATYTEYYGSSVVSSGVKTVTYTRLDSYGTTRTLDYVVVDDFGEDGQIYWYYYTEVRVSILETKATKTISGNGNFSQDNRTVTSARYTPACYVKFANSETPVLLPVFTYFNFNMNYNDYAESISTRTRTYRVIIAEPTGNAWSHVSGASLYSEYLLQASGSDGSSGSYSYSPSVTTLDICTYIDNSVINIGRLFTITEYYSGSYSTGNWYFDDNTTGQFSSGAWSSYSVSYSVNCPEAGLSYSYSSDSTFFVLKPTFSSLYPHHGLLYSSVSTPAIKEGRVITFIELLFGLDNSAKASFLPMVNAPVRNKFGVYNKMIEIDANLMEVVNIVDILPDSLLDAQLTYNQGRSIYKVNNKLFTLYFDGIGVYQNDVEIN